jgi:signal peptide peptidase SppA
VAIANSLAASAAYWIASAASEFHVTPSGEAGSIGVFAEHTDISKWLDKEGINPTLIHAGEFKTEGNQYEPLTDQAAAYIQSRVDDYYTMFVKAVAKYRGVSETKVRNDFGKGRVFGAEQAVASGMADKISTFDQVLTKLTGSKSKSAQIFGVAMETGEISPEEQAAEIADQSVASAIPAASVPVPADPVELDRIRNDFEL